MMKKLIVSMMLLLLTTLSGWTQSQKNWVIVQSNNDTTITYSFLKEDLINLRTYILKLEGTAQLYNEDEKIIKLQDSVINNLNKIILNKDYLLRVCDSTIVGLNQQIMAAEKWGKEQEQMKLKYKKRAKNWYKWFGAGGISGIVLCLILVK